MIRIVFRLGFRYDTRQVAGMQVAGMQVAGMQVAGMKVAGMKVAGCEMLDARRRMAVIVHQPAQRSG